MPIEVRFYKNLFWADGNVKPNRMPSPDQSKTFRRQPTMYDKSNGYIKLFGEWNYAIYKGRHYFLEKAYRLDEDKQSYGYAMRLDFWMEALLRKPKLHGIVDVSNNDELLEKHLQYTFPTLVDPAESTRVNFKETENKWYQHLSVKEAGYDNLWQEVISKTNWDWFIHRHRSEWVRDYVENWVPNYFSQVKGTDAIYIFGQLRPYKLRSGWKVKLAKKINKFIKSLGEEHKVAKVTSPEGSPIVGNYCITYKTEGIGGGDEAVDIDEIDLSGLKDIVEVRLTDLEASPLTVEDFNEHTAVFDDSLDPSFVPRSTFGFKVCRNIYGSLRGKNSSGKDYALALGAPILDESKYIFVGTRVKDTTRYQAFFTYEHEGGYYWTWGYQGIKQQYLTFKVEVAGLPSTASHGVTHWVDRANFGLDFTTYEAARDPQFNPPRSYSYPKPSFIESLDNSYPFQKINNYPGYGFLIYQTIRDWRDWDTIEYKGTASLTDLDVITGINETFNVNYSWSDKSSYLPLIVNETTNLRGNMGVLLMHLDLYLFLHIVPTLNSSRTGEVDSEWARALKLSNISINKSKKTFLDYVQADLIWNGQAIINPYSAEGRYLEWSTKKYKRLRDVTLQENLDLREVATKSGKGISIMKGDYFFTDLEYRLSPITTRDPRKFFDDWHTSSVSYFYQGDSKAKLAQGVLSDFIVLKDDNRKEFFDEIDHTVVLCSNKNKGIEVRGCTVFEKHHFLSSDPKQILYSVNDKQEQLVRYVHLKNLGATIDPNEIALSEATRLKILRAFYEFFGYKFGVNKWSWISDNTLEKASYDRIFDLVGTSWYCHLKKGKVSLIAKKQFQSKIFKKLESKVSIIEPTDKLKKLSLLEKVNQRNYLAIHTEIKPINTKFNFSEDSRFNVSLFTPKPTPYVNVGSNHYILQVKDKFDVIDREILSIPKMPTDALDIANGSRVEELRLMQLRAEQDYAIGTGQLDLKEKRIEEYWYRAKWDAAFGMAERLFNTSKPVLFSGMRAVKSQMGVKSAARSGNLETYMDAQIAQHKSFQSLARQGIRFGMNTAIGQVTAIPNLIEDLRRASFERETAIKELNLRRNELDLRHERAKQDSFLRINAISNVHRRGIINDALLIDEINKTKELNDGQEMKPTHLIIYTPSEEQLKYLIDHKDRHGVDCYIPNQRYEFYIGMKPDVIRFKDLYSENIEELDDLVIRDGFLKMVIGGIKIVDVSEERALIEPTLTEKLQTEVIVEREENSRLKTQNSDLTQELEEVSIKYDEEKDKTKDLTTQNQQLVTQKEKLQVDLTSATNRADTLSQSVHRLEGELTTEKNVKNLLQQEVNQMRPQLTEVKQKNQDLTQKIIDLATRVHNLTNQIAALTNQKITWTYEGDPATGKVNLDQSLHNLDSQLSALGKISTAVGTDTTHLKEQIASLTQRLKECEIAKREIKNKSVALIFQKDLLPTIDKSKLLKGTRKAFIEGSYMLAVIPDQKNLLNDTYRLEKLKTFFERQGITAFNVFFGLCSDMLGIFQNTNKPGFTSELSNPIHWENYETMLEQFQIAAKQANGIDVILNIFSKIEEIFWELTTTKPELENKNLIQKFWPQIKDSKAQTGEYIEVTFINYLVGLFPYLVIKTEWIPKKPLPDFFKDVSFSKIWPVNNTALNLIKQNYSLS